MSTAGTPSRLLKNSSFWALTAIIAVGVLVRIPYLDRRFNLGEAWGVALAERDFGQMLSLFRIEANGILHYLAMWPTVRISESVEVVRLPALGASILTIAAVYWTGTELANRRVGTLGALLYAILPIPVIVATEARMYQFVMLFTVLSFGLLARALRVHERRWWMLYVLALAAATYSSVLSPFLLAPGQLIMLSREIRSNIKTVLVAGAGYLVLVTPQAVLLAVAARTRSLYYYTSPGIKEALGVVRGLTAGSAREFAFVLVPVLAAVVVAGIWRQRRTVTRASWSSHPLVVLSAWAFVPFVLLFVFSQISPVFLDRYLFLSVPGICLLIAYSIASLPRSFSRLALAAVVVLALGGLTLQRTTTSDYRSVGAWLSEHRTQDDPLLIIPLERLQGLSYEYPQLRVGGLLPVEEWHDTGLPPNVTLYKLPGEFGDVPVGPPPPDEVARLAVKTGRVFAVFYGDELGQEATAWARRNCRFERQSFVGLDVAQISDCRPS